MSFDRRELQVLRDRALQMAQQHGSSDPLAMRAYVELAAAADKLDAMAARDQRPIARAAPAPQHAPTTTRELARQVELETEVDEDGNPVEFYDPASG